MFLNTSSTKAIVSGNQVEIYKTEKPIQFGFAGRGGRTKHSSKAIDLETRKRTVMKAREKIGRLYHANFDTNSKFVTLTFRDGSLSHLNDINQANSLFKKFIQRLRYKLNEVNFKYLAIIGFQEKFGREAVHYHFVMDGPPIPQDELLKIWGHGTVWISRIRNFNKIESYLLQHISINTLDERLYGQKLYLASSNLNQPLTFRGTPADNLSQALSYHEEVYGYEYTSEYYGKSQY